MNSWLTDYFKEKKLLLVTLYFFASILLSGSIYYIAEDVTQTDDSYYFYNDGIVNSINIVYLIFLTIILLIFLYKILFELKVIRFEIPKVNNLILMVIGGFCVALLIWYEFYYVTLFYHGEVRLLSGYLISSSILVSMSLTYFFSNKFKSMTILFVIFAALAYFLYECQVVVIAKYVDVMTIKY